MTRSKSKKEPAFVIPMAAESATTLPDGPEWTYELKLDGYRALLLKTRSRVELRSRNDKNLGRLYPEVIRAAGGLRADKLVLDGEIVALDPNGRPSFQALQRRGEDAGHTIVYYAFDLLHLNGRDLSESALIQRRAQLAKSVVFNDTLRLSFDLPGTATEVVEAVRAARLEGVVAKRRNSTYQAGQRSADWIKFKLQKQQEFVVGGFRDNGADGVDALIVGYYEGKELHFAGKVRAGMVPHVRRQLFKKLAPLGISKCPFVNLPDPKKSRWGGGVTADEMKDIQWLRPSVVVQVRFHEWTADARLRASSYLGLREDKSAKQVKRESV
jgi:bifunctional non-homologous end joining protein LigD